MALPLALTRHTTLHTPKLNSKPSTFTCKATLVSLNRKKQANFYELLSLESENVGAEAIKRAYRSLALRYHPDVCPRSKREESTRMFIELQRAYETLSDPIMREKYDYELALAGFGDGEGEEERRRRRRQERSRVSKEVWMNQLSELGVRSAKRMERKKQSCCAYN